MKLELKENMYVCNRYGRIAKIEYIEDNIAYCDNWLYQDYREYIDFINLDSKEIVKEIIKASYDIIDLIEVGDAFKFKELRTHISNKSNTKYYENYIFDVHNEEELEVIKREIKQGKIKLLEILTKEQFEQMSYKVGE